MTAYFACTGNGRGRVFIGDVGQNGWEEIDLLYAGDNYGWSAWEANTCYKPLYCDEHGNTSSPQLLIERRNVLNSSRT